MKTSLLIIVTSMILSIHSQAQNKTLGIGTAAPNTNAALHVESPTNNQGFIMPRLTSAQRAAMASLPLTATDDGLLVYDKDVKKIYVWNGSAWQLMGGGLTLPFRDSVSSSEMAFEVKNTGAGGAGNFIITDTANTSPALNIYHSSSTGIAINANSTIIASSFSASNSATSEVSGSFSNINPSSGVSALSVNTMGLSNAAVIMVNNPSNTDGALFINHSGLGPSIMANKGVDVNVSTDGVAGNFRIDNAVNSAPALDVNTNGSGMALIATTTGGSHAGLFQVINPANTSNVVHATTDGLGSAGYFANTNSGNTLATVGVDTNGSGFAVGAFTTGTGSAGHFQNNNPANTQPALIASTNGAAPALAVDQTNNGVALQINNGTLKYSVFSVPAGGGTITQRAGIYVIQDALTYSFGFGEEGETILVQPSNGSANIEGVVMNGSEVGQFIFIGGVWRMVGFCYTC